jgi:hypothetical protein
MTAITDIAREVGALFSRVLEEPDSHCIVFDDAQLTAFADRIRAEEREALNERIESAERCMAMLTADHNSTPNYLRGFDMAGDHFAKYPLSAKES